MYRALGASSSLAVAVVAVCLMLSAPPGFAWGAPQAQSPEGRQAASPPPPDCLGVPGGAAKMLACGCDDATSCLDCKGEPNGSARMLACGCDDATSCLDCLGNPNGAANDFGCGCGNPAPDQCGVCGGQGPGECGCAPCPPAQQCPYYRLESDAIEGFGNIEKIDFLTGAGSQLACLTEAIKEAKQFCDQQLATPQPGDLGISDDCVVGWFFIGTVAASYPPTGLKYWHRFLPADKRDQQAPNMGYSSVKYTLYFDKDCNGLAAAPQGADVCDAGHLEWHASPISLLWEAGADIEADSTLASFPLEPGKSGKWYVWKASAQAPLLVYDPRHLGRVTSAHQLFGQWTFGGPRLASLGRLDAPAAAQWRDGFDALATLDQDGDGRIAADELNPLALWFDRNRDGRSDPGEVLPIREAGVVSLFYFADRRDARTANVWASKGYERLANGRRLSGRAVDWFTRQADSRAELLNRELAANELCGAARPMSAGAAASPADDAVRPASGSSARIDGLWQWSSDDPAFAAQGAYRPQGYLIFQHTADGHFMGHSLIEIPFRKDFAGARSVAMLIALAGEKRMDPRTGREFYAFDIRYQNGSRVHSVALLSADGSELRGSSRAVVNFQGRPETISYTWQARRG